jgi:hypothetical protein
MEKKIGASLFRSEMIDESRREGYISFNLYCDHLAETKFVANILYWHATDQFNFRAKTELPVEIVEELIAEAKSKIRAK